MLTKLSIRLEGLSPLMVHSPRLADPQDEMSDRVKAARKAAKAQPDSEELENKKLQEEYLAYIYLDEDGKPVLPGDNIRKAIIEGAERAKRYDGNKVGPLLYCDGLYEIKVGGKSIREHSEIKSLFKVNPKLSLCEAMCMTKTFVDRRLVHNKKDKSRMPCSRPIFGKDIKEEVKWTVDAALEYETTLKRETVANACANVISIGAYRTRFGRFRIKI